MVLVEVILLSYLVVAAVTVCAMKSLLASVIIFASYGIAMTVIWVLLAAPDLAITEAAVGTGISSILFFVVAKRIRAMEEESREEKELKKNAG